MWSCRGPDGAPLATSAWTPWGHVADTCAQQGGALRVTPDGSVRLAAPAGTRIAGYDLWRAANDDRIPDDTKIIETVGTTPFTVSSGTAGTTKDPLAAANLFSAKHAPLDALTLQVACHDECGNPWIDLFRARVAIDDELAPTASAAAAGDDAVIVNADDRGGGVAAVTMAVDGGAAQTLPSSCAPPYTALVPCPTSVARAFAVNAPDGEHTVTGTVADAAGNVTAWGPVHVSISRAISPAPPPNAAVLPGAAAQVIKLARTSVGHAPGAAAKLTGTLTTAAGAPVAGATLGVSSFDLATDAAAPRALAPVVTGAGGAFTVTLEREGAQRVTLTSPTGAQATATVRTNLSVALKSSRGHLVKGRVLTLSGHLRGAGPSAKGTPVTIESIVNRKWLPVGSARARADGSYAWKYRFVHLARDTIFSFRAVVERAPGWPWASERSAPLKVRVDVP